MAFPGRRFVMVIDSGNEPFSATTPSDVGRAVAAVMQKPAETRNRYLSIASFTTTQNQVLEILEEMTHTPWVKMRISSANLNQAGGLKVMMGEISGCMELLWATTYGDGQGEAIDAGANAMDLLGVVKDDLRTAVRDWLLYKGIQPSLPRGFGPALQGVPQSVSYLTRRSL